jgi:hypothetical protein
VKLARLVLLFLSSASVSSVSAQALGQSAQISEGVRVMAQVGQTGFGPKGSPYMISPQPHIYSYMAGGKDRLFDDAANLLKFFQSFPPEIQRRGLWLTPAGLAERDTQEDKNRLSQLVGEARRLGVLMYACSAAEHGGRSGLVAWQCAQQSPSGRSQTSLCIPRDKPHLGHPWWDCAERATEAK